MTDTPQLDAIRVVAFDVHDTLAHWSAGGPRSTALAIQELLAEHGVEIGYQTFLAARAMVMLHDAARQPLSDPHDFLRRIFRRMDVELPAELVAPVVETYAKGMAMRLFDDSVDVMRGVRRLGLWTCTFTTLPHWAVREVLAPLDDALGEFISCSEAAAIKGHPAFYQSITQRLRVQPEQILAIGDDPAGDVIVPTRIGWRCVHLQRGRRTAAPPGAVAAVGDLRGFLELIQQNRGR
jgi:FMN phosphatase YigB (HAD superfamily)